MEHDFPGVVDLPRDLADHLVCAVPVAGVEPLRGDERAKFDPFIRGQAGKIAENIHLLDRLNALFRRDEVAVGASIFANVFKTGLARLFGVELFREVRGIVGEVVFRFRLGIFGTHALAEPPQERIDALTIVGTDQLEEFVVKEKSLIMALIPARLGPKSIEVPLGLDEKLRLDLGFEQLEAGRCR